MSLAKEVKSFQSRCEDTAAILALQGGWSDWSDLELLQSKQRPEYSVPAGAQEPMQRLSSGHSFSVRGRLQKGFKSCFRP